MSKTSSYPSKQNEICRLGDLEDSEGFPPISVHPYWVCQGEFSTSVVATCSTLEVARKAICPGQVIYHATATAIRRIPCTNWEIRKVDDDVANSSHANADRATARLERDLANLPEPMTTTEERDLVDRFEEEDRLLVLSHPDRFETL